MKSAYTLISKACKGYTLIELLVAVTIVGLIFAIGFIGYREYSRRQSVVSAVREIKSDLRLAQENAIAGRKPENCNGELTAYQVRFSAPANTYTVEAICSGIPFAIKEKEFTPEVVFSAPAVNPIQFYTVGRGTNITGGNVVITVTGTSAYSQTVEVGPAGEIK